MKKFFLLTAFIAATYFCFAQSNIETIKAGILRSADSMASAFKGRDWKTIVHFSPQSVLDISGGADSLIKMTESIMNNIPNNAVKQFSIGPIVQVVKTANDWQCIIEQHMLMELNGLRITMMSPLIGQSFNDGASWTFFDSKGDDATARMFLPTLSNELVLPKGIQNVEQLYTPPVVKKDTKTTTKPAAKKPVAKKSTIKKN